MNIEEPHRHYAEWGGGGTDVKSILWAGDKAQCTKSLLGKREDLSSNPHNLWESQK